MSDAAPSSKGLHATNSDCIGRVSGSAIARQVGLDRKTVRRYIARGLEPPVYGPREPRTTQLQQFERYLRERIAAFLQRPVAGCIASCAISATTATTPSLRSFCATSGPPRRRQFEVRFEIPAGRQAQVDFAHFRTAFTDGPGAERIIWLFSLVLGHSRMLWGHFVAGIRAIDALIPTPIRFHVYCMCPVSEVSRQICLAVIPCACRVFGGIRDAGPCCDSDRIGRR